MPKQRHIDEPFHIDDSMEREELFEQFIFLNDQDFEKLREWINKLSDSFNEADEERYFKDAGH